MRMKTISFLVLGIFLIGIVSAITCCERLAGTNNNGAWCQNVEDKTLCATSPFESVSAYCESTSYCKLGTCILQSDGICMQNTPRKSCEERGGFWSESAKSSLSQCQLGCCIIGDQAALITEIACNKMSVLYGGVQSTFLGNIDDEITCLANANPTAMGACVFTKENVRSCELTTKKDCTDRQKSSASLNIEFHEGFLCSAPEFQTNCFKTQTTRCEGDDVYFVDSCGNLANIYDSAKVNDDDYWTKIQDPTCSSGILGNKNSASCGNCNYLSGSMCREKQTGDAVVGGTLIGNYICKNLDCADYRGQYSGSSTGKATANNYPKHGETWCSTDNTGTGTPNSPGASSFRLMCYNGEVSVEQCDPTRQKICSEAEDSISGYFTGNCKVNRWQDCAAQTESGACEDGDFRDCHWIDGYEITENGIQKGNGICVPNFAPGFDVNGNAQVTGGESCATANSICYVTVQRGWLNALFNPDEVKWGCKEGGIIEWIGGLFGEDTENNCDCLGNDLSKIWKEYSGKNYGNDWKNARENVCRQIGDCGEKVNFIGKAGYPQTSIQVITNLTE